HGDQPTPVGCPIDGLDTARDLGGGVCAPRLDVDDPGPPPSTLVGQDRDPRTVGRPPRCAIGRAGCRQAATCRSVDLAPVDLVAYPVRVPVEVRDLVGDATSFGGKVRVGDPADAEPVILDDWATA